MIKPKLRLAIALLIGLVLLTIGGIIGNEMIGRFALEAETSDDLVSVPSDLCSSLSYELCRATKNCKAVLKSNSTCSSSQGIACPAVYDMAFNRCEAIDEETLASYAAMNELCTSSGGTPGFISIDSKYPTCSCGTVGREEFFASGNRTFQSQLDLGCTTAKEFCEEFYEGTWTPSTITATALVPDATERSCRTLLTGNVEPVNVWDESTQECTAFTYEPRFPECMNSYGVIVSRAGGF